MVHFEKKSPEIKTNIFLPLWLASITLVLKEKPVEKKKPIFGTWNVSDVIVYVWFIYSQIK